MRIFAFMLLTAFFALLGCNNGTTNLDVETIRWDQKDNDGFFRFYTNDSQNYGRPFAALSDQVNNSATYEIECKKVSGHQEIAYGLVFGAVDYENFYSLNISTTGYYTLSKRNSSNLMPIKEWERSDKLLTGYNKLNNLKVVKAGSRYTVFINGTEVHQFTDSSINGNKIGFFAWVGDESDESFPNKPVDIRFREVTDTTRAVSMVYPSVRFESAASYGMRNDKY